MTFAEAGPPGRPLPRYSPQTWPVHALTTSSESDSPTCSMNSVLMRQPSSRRGRRATLFRTWCFASTTPSRHQASSSRVRGPDSPNDEEQRSPVRSFPGLLQRSVLGHPGGFSESVGCVGFPPSTNSSSIMRMCAEPTDAVLGRTRPRWMRRCGATSVAHHGSWRGGYKAQGSSSSGLGRPVPSEPGPGNPRFASPDFQASCCSFSSVGAARHRLRSAGLLPRSKPFGTRGSACRVTQIGSAAAARAGQVVDHLVRVGDDLQRGAGRAGLLAGLPIRAPGVAGTVPGRGPSTAATTNYPSSARAAWSTRRPARSTPGPVRSASGSVWPARRPRRATAPASADPIRHPCMIAADRPATRTPRRTIRTSVTPVTVSTREWLHEPSLMH